MFQSQGQCLFLKDENSLTLYDVLKFERLKHFAQPGRGWQT